MPEMNGFDTCQLIKQTFPDLKAPVLFFSGSTHENSKKHAREAGGDDFIAKPFSPDKLIKRIDQWVSKQPALTSGKSLTTPAIKTIWY
jgi:DNA-binding response OmpR family regulator